MIDAALAPVTADGTVAGIGLWEISLSRCAESDKDYAAKLVDMSELGDGPINIDMRFPTGIGGLNPREHASAQVGQRSVELAVEVIGKKAGELLDRLPDDQRAFSQPAISPEHWWLV